MQKPGKMPRPKPGLGFDLGRRRVTRAGLRDDQKRESVTKVLANPERESLRLLNKSLKSVTKHKDRQTIGANRRGGKPTWAEGG